MRTYAPILILTFGLLTACSPGPGEPVSDTAGALLSTTSGGADTRLLARAEEFEQSALYDSLTSVLSRAAAYYEAARDWESYARTYNRMSESAWRRHSLDEATTYAQHALETASLHYGANHGEVARAYYMQAVIMHLRGKYADALDLANRSLNLQNQAHAADSMALADTYNIIGLCYEYKGDYKQALLYLEKSHDLRKALLKSTHPRLATILNNLGSVYWQLGDFEHARPYFERSLDIRLSTDKKNHPSTAEAYNNLGVIHESQRNLDAALAHYTEAARIYANTVGPDFFHTSIVYANIGRVYQSLGDFNRSRTYHTRAIGVLSRSDPHPYLADSYRNLADLEVAEGYYANGFSNYRTALDILHHLFGPRHPDIAAIYNSIGSVHLMQKRYGPAIAAYEQGVQANTATPLSNLFDPASGLPPDLLNQRILIASFAGLAKAHHRRYRARMEQRDLERAYDIYEVAAVLLDQVRHAYRDEASKMSLAAEAAEIYADAFSVALERWSQTEADAHLESAFSYSERSKGAILLDRLYELNARAYAGIPDSLLQSEQQLRIRLSRLEEQLRLQPTDMEEQDSSHLASMRRVVFDLRQTHTELVSRFEHEFPEYYQLKYQTRTSTLADVQATLADEQALVSYSVGPDSTFAFILTRDSIAVQGLTSTSQLEPTINAFRESVVGQHYEQFVQHSYTLYQLLFAPLADHLRGIHALVIVPDGPLNYIPFEALLTESRPAAGKLLDYGRLPYLVKDFSVTYAYSSTLYVQGKTRLRKRAPYTLLAFAPSFQDSTEIAIPAPSHPFSTSLDPAETPAHKIRVGALPSSRREVNGVAALFRQRSSFWERVFGLDAVVLEDSEATEGRFKTSAHAYRYVHLATHGLLDESHPEGSGILLATSEGSNEDGIIHVDEVYNLQLNAELVVLSACETGLGRLAKGEGLIGLARGFLYAGAARLLVSLWKADDHLTSELMITFYQEVAAGSDHAEALRVAKLRMMHRNPRYARPFYWAGFVLIGA